MEELEGLTELLQTPRTDPSGLLMPLSKEATVFLLSLCTGDASLLWSEGLMGSPLPFEGRQQSLWSEATFSLYLMHHKPQSSAKGNYSLNLQPVQLFIKR